MGNVLVKNDLIFQLIFGRQKNESILVDLLNAILCLPASEKISRATIDSSVRLDIINPSDKYGIMDIRAITCKGFRINIEMQLRNEYNIDKRTLFYWASMYSKQINEGDSYSLLNKTIAINIIDFKFNDNIDYHSIFHLYEDTHKDLKMTDIMEIHFIELEKFRYLEKDYSSSLNNWLLFIDNATAEVLEMAKLNDPGIKLAEKEFEHILSDAETMRLYELRQKYIRDEKNNLEGARNDGLIAGKAEGIAVGKAEGIAEGKVETAKKMLENNYSIDEICKITGLEEKDFN